MRIRTISRAAISCSLADCFADRRDDLFDGDLPSGRTLDFLDQDQLLLVVVVGDAKCSATMAAQRGMAVLRRLLDVLRVMIDAANDDQVLDPAGDEKFAILVEKAEIAGAQPVLGAAGRHPRPEHRSSRLGVVPIALRDMRPGNPNLPDQPRPPRHPCFRIDDRQALANELPATPDEYRSILLLRRGNNLAALQGSAIDAAGNWASPPPARRNQQCRLRHAVGGVNAFGTEAVGREGGGEPVNRPGPDRLGPIQCDLPAREIDVVDLFGAVAFDA